MPLDDAKLDKLVEGMAELRVGQVRLEGGVSTVLARLDQHDSRAQDVEARLRVLEQWRWSQVGVGAAGGGAVGFLVILAEHAMRAL